jgi:carbonic anhydrase/acetyltransferase-like protein (isoleucine patch superfamily)
VLTKYYEKLAVLVPMLIIFATIEISVMQLQSGATISAISGKELGFMSESSGFLNIKANEPYNYSSYNKDWPNIHSNVKTDFNANVTIPEIQETSIIHPFGVIIGNCHIGKFVLVAPTAVCRGDEGTPIYVGDHSNMQDGTILHGLETTEKGNYIDGRRYSAAGEKLMANSSQYANGYSVVVGSNTSLAHDSMVHGPAWVGNNTFVGMDSIIFNAKVGNNVAIGISSTISNGVSIPDNRFVPPDSLILAQEEADALPLRAGSPYENTNEAVLDVNKQLAKEYETQLDLDKLAEQREKQTENGMLETGMSAP